MTCSACAVIYKPRAESSQTRFQPNNYHRRSVITEIFSQARERKRQRTAGRKPRSIHSSRVAGFREGTSQQVIREGKNLQFCGFWNRGRNLRCNCRRLPLLEFFRTLRRLSPPRWFRVAVLPLDGELAVALLYRESRKQRHLCSHYKLIKLPLRKTSPLAAHVLEYP